MQQRLYGKTLMSNSVNNANNQIIESAAIMKLQQDKQQDKHKTTVSVNTYI